MLRRSCQASASLNASNCGDLRRYSVERVRTLTLKGAEHKHFLPPSPPGSHSKHENTSVMRTDADHFKEFDKGIQDIEPIIIFPYKRPGRVSVHTP